MQEQKPFIVFAKNVINYYGIAFIISAIFFYVVYHTANGTFISAIQQELTYTELFDLLVLSLSALGLLLITKPLTTAIGALLMSNDYFRRKYIERLKEK